jgi:hypothetical protein
MKIVALFFILLFFTSCSRKEKTFIALGFQKDLIPEGIAIDPGTHTIFLNSLRHSKIVKCNMDGTSPVDFINTNQYEYLPGFGMTVMGDTLFALGNSLFKKDSRSILLLLNVKTAALINAYTLNDTTFKYLNDLAVSANGDIFITDSENDKIYTIHRAKGLLEVYLESGDIANSNGIALSDDEKYLYLASYKTGIRIVEKLTKKIMNEPNLENRGIDGMKYYKNSLIGIISGKKTKTENGVYRFFLNRENSSIIRKEKIISWQENFKVPTTFAMMDGYMYFTINSQLDNFDEESGKIIDSSKLENYQLMKFKIE